MNYVNGTTEFSEIELETAKSSLTFEVIERETTVTEVSVQSILAYSRRMSHSYNTFVSLIITDQSVINELENNKD